MKDKNVEEIVESLMKLPKALFEQIKKNSGMIQDLNIQIERLMQLIASLHDIDLDKIRKEYSEL